MVRDPVRRESTPSTPTDPCSNFQVHGTFNSNEKMSESSFGQSRSSNESRLSRCGTPESRTAPRRGQTLFATKHIFVLINVHSPLDHHLITIIQHRSWLGHKLFRMQRTPRPHCGHAHLNGNCSTHEQASEHARTMDAYVGRTGS